MRILLPATRLHSGILPRILPKKCFYVQNYFILWSTICFFLGVNVRHLLWHPVKVQSVVDKGDLPNLEEVIVLKRTKGQHQSVYEKEPGRVGLGLGKGGVEGTQHPARFKLRDRLALNKYLNHSMCICSSVHEKMHVTSALWSLLPEILRAQKLGWVGWESL